MFNIFLFISWPVLIFGTLGAYKMGKNRWGNKGAWIASVAFVLALITILRVILGDGWWMLFLAAYIAA